MVAFDNTDIAFEHKSRKQLLKAYWLFKLVGNPSLVKVGKVLVNIALRLRIPMGWAIKDNIFEQFCGGESIADCTKTIEELYAFNIGTILDYSVEGKEVESEFDSTADEIARTIQTAHKNEQIPFCVFKVSGVSSYRILTKVNSREMLNDDEVDEWQRVVDRVDRLCGMAAETGTPLFIDAEETWYQEAIDGLANAMMEKYNTEDFIIYNTLQMYRHDRLAYLKKSHSIAQEKGYKLGYKLVRGAYMEKEREKARDEGYPTPIQPDKPATDRDFNAALDYCVDHLDDIAICCGSHNEQSSLHLVDLMKKKGIKPEDPRVYFAQLYGMSDHISFNLSKNGFNVAKYVPYGPIREVIPYLIRRAEENTSVEGQTGRELSLIMKERKRRRRSKYDEDLDQAV